MGIVFRYIFSSYPHLFLRLHRFFGVETNNKGSRKLKDLVITTATTTHPSCLLPLSFYTLPLTLLLSLSPNTFWAAQFS